MHRLSDVKIFDIQMDSTVNNTILANRNGKINIDDFLAVMEKGENVIIRNYVGNLSSEKRDNKLFEYYVLADVQEAGAGVYDKVYTFVSAGRCGQLGSTDCSITLRFMTFKTKPVRLRVMFDKNENNETKELSDCIVGTLNEKTVYQLYVYTEQFVKTASGDCYIDLPDKSISVNRVIGIYGTLEDSNYSYPFGIGSGSSYVNVHFDRNNKRFVLNTNYMLSGMKGHFFVQFTKN